MKTYVKRDAWGNTEIRFIADPVTHADASPESLVGRLVKVRPHYHVPSRSNGFQSVRSPFTFDAQVIETFGDSMVIVRYTDAESAPWGREAAFYPRELHSLHSCECAACKGNGITERDGA